MKASDLAGHEPVIVDVVRTPVGRRNGALREWHATALLAHVLSALIERSGVPRGDVDDVIAGCATQVGEQAGNIARTALLMADFPVTVPGTTVQRACGSSQQAIHFADNLIRSGVCEVVIAGGVELMSKTQGGNDDTRYGLRYPPSLVERFSMPSMGIAAERIAERWQLDRGYLDELALRSHALSAEAQDAGRFDRQMVPLAGVDGQRLERDEGVRRDTSLDKLASLKASFREDGRVTAGNASQVSDGAAAILIMTAAKAREYGLRPRAMLRAQRVVGVDPSLMLTGPIPATQQILARSGLALADIDLFEINEAFSSVLGAWLAELKPDLSRVNVNGGSIAVGHPLGSTGARLMAGLVDELERRGGRYGLQSMCCGGGLGTATIIERVE
ncbi:acetyl-CoA C-acyltransferase [Pandoraea fibrosis]|uniref:Acetyl-CoA C-acyltransferase n=1 Tax=Pandoraea fibrosis TaxID=1891094 RepID=A0ABX6HSI8_9BURK|nr:thiolase family protein [Pandoraea fibrosis]QHE92568.1 acetyl-CoA C-acyltransferase [Pandoraea fibrosis]QHF13876.1 acetyl-CoA C-acyltransferase [Pandoraea fibrosis]